MLLKGWLPSFDTTVAHTKWDNHNAVAYLYGSPLYPRLRGIVTFEKVRGGSLVCTEIYGLPSYQAAQNGNPPIGPHGFHIHQFGNCMVGNPDDPFQSAGSHWNPDNQPHGNHAGDFPVLFSNNGYAWMCFFTNRFIPRDIIGRSVVIHENPDDYSSQPAGNAGRRIACGVIVNE